MKKLLSFVLVLALVFTSVSPLSAFADDTPEFRELGDKDLLPYLESTVYETLVTDLNSSGYFVENVEAVYISQEYLDELAFNSQENIYFGYTLSQLDQQFQGKRYVFTLGENRETIVKEFESYDDTYDQIISNVAVGTGVILLCVTVSAVTAGVGAPAVSMIFAVAAKTGAAGALSGGILGGVSAGIVTGIQTGDMSAALESAAVSGSEGFKWGAITGAVAGGAGEGIALKGATLNGLTMNEAAIIQKESKYPLDVIKQFASMDQYNICKEAGLTTKLVDGKTALVRNIDLEYVDEFRRTNLQRMQEGLAALDPSGEAYQLHHIGQNMDSTLAILTEAEHMQGGNNKIWHLLEGASKIDRSKFDKQRMQFWKNMAEILVGEL